MIYEGVPREKRASAGVAILIKKTLKNLIHSYTFVNERIITIRLKNQRGYMSIIGVYAPEEGRNEDSDEFYDILQKTVNGINKNDYLIIAGDLNARVGKTPVENIIGTEGEVKINNNGYKLKEFALNNELRLTNTFFRHKQIHKYTWSARGSATIIDYIIANKKTWPLVQDTRVYRGPDISSDHYLLISKLKILKRWKKATSKNVNTESALFKVHLLKEDSIRTLFQNRLENYVTLKQRDNNINQEWNNIKEAIIKAATEVLGTRKKSFNKRRLKYWDDEIKELIDNKKQAYLKLMNQPDNQDLRIDYKRKSAVVKKKVRQIKRDSWEQYISEIEHDVNGRQDKAYKIMKYLNKEDKDSLEINAISEDNWLQYYKTLWTNNDDNNWILSEADVNVDPITMEELQEELKLSHNKKTPGSDRINIELLKYATTVVKKRILEYINMCWKNGYIPEEWNIAQVCPIHKKGSKHECKNYRGISLLNVCYKLYARIINKRLLPILDTKILDAQHGFRKGRSCSDCIFTLTQLIEKRREFNQPTYFAFIDYEKAFDRVDRGRLWEILRRRGTPVHLVRAVQSLYLNNKIQIKITNSTNKMAEINQGVRQGCPLSPTLFNIYIDEVTTKWLQTIKNFKINNTNYTTILFADDQVIISQNENDLQEAIFKLNKIASDFNLLISTSKSKTMAFKGSLPLRVKIVINDQIIEQVNTFKYLGYNVTYGTNKEIESKINIFNLFCGTIRRTLGKKVQKGTLLKFYKVMALPALLYGSENWVLKKRDESRIEASEMKFLRYVAGYTLMDKKRNDEIRTELKMKNIVDIIKQYQLRWNEHVERMPDTRMTKSITQYVPEGRRSLGRPKKRWRDQF